MLVASFSPALIPIVLCQGLGCAFGTVAHPIITQAIFGLKDYSTIYGIISAMGSLGGALAPVFAASVYDAQEAIRAPFWPWQWRWWQSTWFMGESALRRKRSLRKSSKAIVSAAGLM